MTVDFQPSDGPAVDLGNAFVQNYGALLCEEPGNLSTHVAAVGLVFTNASNQTIYALGMRYMAESLALGNLSSYLHTNEYFSGIGNVLIPHISTLTVSFNGSPQCIEAVVVAIGVTGVLTLFDQEEAIRTAIQFLHEVTGVFVIADIGSHCVSFGVQ